MPAVPTSVRCPVVFSAAGEEFIAKKLRSGVYFLGLSRPYHRARFGTADEIREDIAYVAEYGKLPQDGSRTW
jgi:hypothetical protein